MSTDEIKDKAKDVVQDNVLTKEIGKSILDKASEWLGGFFGSKAKKADEKRDTEQSAESNEKEREETIKKEKKGVLDKEQEHFQKTNKHKLRSQKIRRDERIHKGDKIDRRRFGARGLYEYGQAVDFFSPQSLIILEDDVKKQSNLISSLIANDIKNKSVSNIFDKTIVVTYLKDKEKENQYLKMLEEYNLLQEKLNTAKLQQPQNEAWKDWTDGGIPSESARQKLARAAVDKMPGVVGNIPIVGAVVLKAFDIYGQFKASFDELQHDITNILQGTRKKTSLARIGGMLAGSIVGAITVGATLAAASSVIPGVGTIIGGTAGIIVGAVMGAAAGGSVGVEVVEFLASKTGNVDEREHEMEYRHLRVLRKAYGLKESEVLKMHSYLVNQVKVHGSDSDIGKLLTDLKKSALEEGRENALAKLCIYFIGQEQALRDGLYQVGIEYIVNQEERVNLLQERRLLEDQKNKLDAKDLEYKDEIKDDSLDKIEGVIKTNNMQVSSRVFIENYISLFDSIASNSSEDELIDNLQKKIMEEFGIPKSKAEEVSGLMLKILKDDQSAIKPELDSILTKRELGMPTQQWEQAYKQNKESLYTNAQAGQGIEHKRFEMRQERDDIVDVLKEFKQPSEFIKHSKFLGKKKPTWIYGDLMKKKSAFLAEKFSMEDPIKGLFDPVVDHKGDLIKVNLGDDEQYDLISKPKDVRSFGDYKSKSDKNENQRAQFRENMREDYLENAKKEAKRYNDDLWRGVFVEDYEKALKRDLCQSDSDIKVMDTLFSTLSRTIPDLMERLQKSDGSDMVEINNELTQIQGTLLKTQQTFPELEYDLEKQIEAVTDIQNYTKFSIMKNVYVRRDLAIQDDSGVNDLYPFEKYGMVEHLPDESGKLIKATPQQVIEKMREVEEREEKLIQKIGFDIENMSAKEFWNDDSFDDDKKNILRDACENHVQINMLEKLFQTLDEMPALMENAKKYGIDNMTRKALEKNMETLEAAQKDFPVPLMLQDKIKALEAFMKYHQTHAHIQHVRSAKAHSRETADNVASSQDIDLEKGTQQDDGKRSDARKDLANKLKAKAAKADEAKRKPVLMFNENKKIKSSDEVVLDGVVPDPEINVNDEVHVDSLSQEPIITKDTEIEPDDLNQSPEAVNEDSAQNILDNKEKKEGQKGKAKNRNTKM